MADTHGIHFERGDHKVINDLARKLMAVLLEHGNVEACLSAAAAAECVRVMLQGYQPVTRTRMYPILFAIMTNGDLPAELVGMQLTKET